MRTVALRGKLVTAIITALVSFAATNIDDIVILMLFYAQVNVAWGFSFCLKAVLIGYYSRRFNNSYQLDAPD